MNLKEAIQKGKLKDFIKEQEKNMPPADRKRFEETLHAMIKNLPASPATSSGDDDEN